MNERSLTLLKLDQPSQQRAMSGWDSPAQPRVILRGKNSQQNRGANFAIACVNGAFEKMFKMRYQDAIGKDISYLFGPGTSFEHQQSLLHSMATAVAIKDLRVILYTSPPSATQEEDCGMRLNEGATGFGSRLGARWFTAWLLPLKDTWGHPSMFLLVLAPGEAPSPQVLQHAASRNQFHTSSPRFGQAALSFDARAMAVQAEKAKRIAESNLHTARLSIDSQKSNPFTTQMGQSLSVVRQGPGRQVEVYKNESKTLPSRGEHASRTQDGHMRSLVDSPFDDDTDYRKIANSLAKTFRKIQREQQEQVELRDPLSKDIAATPPEPPRPPPRASANDAGRAISSRLQTRGGPASPSQSRTQKTAPREFTF